MLILNTQQVPGDRVMWGRATTVLDIHYFIGPGEGVISFFQCASVCPITALAWFPDVIFDTSMCSYDLSSPPINLPSSGVFILGNTPFISLFLMDGAVSGST